MAVQVVRVLRDDDSVRQVRLRDDETPDRSVVMTPEAWADFLYRVHRGEFDHHMAPS